MSKLSLKCILIFVLAALLLFGIFFYNASTIEEGSFISDFIENGGVEIIGINKIDTRTDEIKLQKFLNSDEKDRLANLIDHQIFKKINSDTVEFKAHNGYLIEGRDKEGNLMMSIKSYGDEFLTGFITPCNSPKQEFKFKIKDRDWINHMEWFFL